MLIIREVFSRYDDVPFSQECGDSIARAMVVMDVEKILRLLSLFLPQSVSGYAVDND